MASIFGGGGGWEIGAIAAGIRPTWTVEIDPAIAEVAEANVGHRVIVADALAVDPRALEPPDILVASPPCQAHSVARSKALAPRSDADAGRCVVEYVRVLRPRAVLVENVPPYAGHPTFRAICRELMALGYWCQWGNVNAADFGKEQACPFHATASRIAAVGSVEHNSLVATAAAYAGLPAMTPPGEEPMRDAWIAAEHLAKAIAAAFAGAARCDGRVACLLRLAREEAPIPDGRVAGRWMSAAMSAFESMGDTSGNIGWWLKERWDGLYSQRKLSITSTEVPTTTILRICASIRATALTRPHIGQPSVRHGCGLCVDWAIPQTRRRLILRAVRDGLLAPLPPPVPWRGWYEAIEDLIPSLPEGRFAQWQLRRLGWLDETALVQAQPKNRGAGYRAPDEPAATVSVDPIGGPPRAFLVNGTPASGVPDAREPAQTVNATLHEHGRAPLALLVDGKNTGSEWGDGARRAVSPAFTVVTDDRPSHWPRAVIAHPSADNPRFPVADASEPVFAVTGTHGSPRAWLDTGRVVKMTPRALARFQSFPDSYELPARNSLATKIIGNAIPCLLARRLLESVAP